MCMLYTSEEASEAYITESARPIICGGIRAEGPSVADVQGEDGEGPAPEMSRGGYGGGAKLKFISRHGLPRSAT